ncbi:hypothetical protein MLD52_15125, partial [Puniceicoccaceae bacterium K14]|nr:hypothetical protein [Puniceicoccaceae bacterium K14]
SRVSGSLAFAHPRRLYEKTNNRKEVDSVSLTTQNIKSKIQKQHALRRTLTIHTEYQIELSKTRRPRTDAYALDRLVLALRIVDGVSNPFAHALARDDNHRSCSRKIFSRGYSGK